MTLSFEQKRIFAIRAPLGGGLLRADTRVIERPGFLQIVTPSAPGSMLNEIAWSELADHACEGAIDDAIATYAAIGKSTKWCVGPWTRPTDFGARLERRGFTSWPVRGMGCATDRQFDASYNVRIVPVDRANADRFVDTSIAGWGLAADQRDHERATIAQALADERQNALLFGAVTNDGEWIGTAGVLLRDGFGYLVGTQVLASARGRGAYRALVAARLAALRDRGIPYAVTQARQATSAPILERLGFETLFESRCYWRELDANS